VVAIRSLGVLAAWLVGCGGATATTTGRDGSADATASLVSGPGDASAELSPSGDVAKLPTVAQSCDAGFFVELHDEAGVRTFTSGCTDSGLSAPTLVGRGVCGEDCLCTELKACSGSAVLTIWTGCQSCTTASCSVIVAYTGEDGGLTIGSGWLQFAAFPADAGSLAGTFSGFFSVRDDAGSTSPGDPASASFCVLYEP
jgi:hypothetical protein